MNYEEFLTASRHLFWGSIDYTANKIENEANRKLFLDVSFRIGNVLANSYDQKSIRHLKRIVSSLELQLESEKITTFSLFDLMTDKSKYIVLPFEIIKDILKNLELRFITGYNGY